MRCHLKNNPSHKDPTKASKNIKRAIDCLVANG
jgi:hypothetical protein